MNKKGMLGGPSLIVKIALVLFAFLILIVLYGRGFSFLQGIESCPTTHQGKCVPASDCSDGNEIYSPDCSKKNEVCCKKDTSGSGGVSTGGGDGDGDTGSVAFELYLEGEPEEIKPNNNLLLAINREYKFDIKVTGEEIYQCRAILRYTAKEGLTYEQRIIKRFPVFDCETVQKITINPDKEYKKYGEIVELDVMAFKEGVTVTDKTSGIDMLASKKYYLKIGEEAKCVSKENNKPEILITYTEIENDDPSNVNLEISCLDLDDGTYMVNPQDKTDPCGCKRLSYIFSENSECKDYYSDDVTYVPKDNDFESIKDARSTIITIERLKDDPVLSNNIPKHNYICARVLDGAGEVTNKNFNINQGFPAINSINTDLKEKGYSVKIDAGENVYPKTYYKFVTDTQENYECFNNVGYDSSFDGFEDVLEYNSINIKNTAFVFCIKSWSNTGIYSIKYVEDYCLWGKYKEWWQIFKEGTEQCLVCEDNLKAKFFSDEIGCELAAEKCGKPFEWTGSKCINN